MANQVYSAFMQRLLGAYLGLSSPATTPQFMVHMLNSVYSFSDDDSDVSAIAAAEIATPKAIQNVVIAGGNVSGDNVLDVYDGSDTETVSALVISCDGGLVAYIDQGDLTSIPTVSNGITLDLLWSSDGIINV